MLDNGGGTLYARGQQDNPEQIQHKVNGRDFEKQVEPFSRPAVRDSLLLGGTENQIPVPVHDIERNQRYEDDEIEKVVTVAGPVVLVDGKAWQYLLLVCIDSIMFFHESGTVVGRIRSRASFAQALQGSAASWEHCCSSC